MHELAHIQEAEQSIRSITNKRPEIGIILGSGLGSLADEMEDAVVIPYKDIPHFAQSQAVGHANQLVIGSLEGKTVVAMKGRYHFYEGYSLDEVTFPVRVLKALGIEKLMVTNAAGAVNEQYKPGDLMLITDHINFTGTNPLIGPNNEELGTRFPDVTSVYDESLQTLAKNIAAEEAVTLHEGVYTWFTGPTYETPAEVRMVRMFGGDAVGMSTVPEVIVSAHAGLKVLGISCLTNMAAGILDEPLSHDDVIQVADKSRASFITLVKSIISNM